MSNVTDYFECSIIFFDGETFIEKYFKDNIRQKELNN